MFRSHMAFAEKYDDLLFGIYAVADVDLYFDLRRNLASIKLQEAMTPAESLADETEVFHHGGWGF